MQQKFFSLLIAIVASVGTMFATEGALPGLFSVSAKKKVQFSQGNLQCIATDAYHWTWQFASQQYEVMREGNQWTTTGTHTLDLFGWGTTGYNNKYPTMTSTTTHDYGPDPATDIVGTRYEWGPYLSITNGGNATGLWRTMTADEWNYILYTRANANMLKGKATVNEVNGYLLLPDLWVCPSGLSVNTEYNSFSDNVYSASDWTIMEQAGAVFIPCGGERYERALLNADFAAYYWTSSYYGEVDNYRNAYTLDFSKNNAVKYCKLERGRAVRLVQNSSVYTISTSAVSGTVLGGGQYDLNATATLTAIPTECYHFVQWSDGNEDNPRSIIVTGDATYIAQFEQIQYQITFNNYNDGELQKNNVACGEIPVYTGATPTKAADAQYTYTFNGWTPNIVAAEADAIYTATYSQTVNTYTVTFLDEDDSQLSQQTVTYGSAATAPDVVVPNCHVLTWDKDFSNITGDLTVTAVWSVLPLASGTCGAEGDNLTWELSCDGTLTIIGTGAMIDYEWDSASDEVNVPWSNHRESIQSVVISQGVTNLGNYAFRYCGNLASLTIPNSVTMIGESAFYNCNSLLSVSIPNSVTSIGDGAFYGCSSLSSITIPNSVTNIGMCAFYECTSLTSIEIPSSVSTIGVWAFWGCIGLTSVYISDLSAWCTLDFLSIDSNPLYYAHNLYLNGELLSDIVIPECNTSIGSCTFAGSTCLTSISLSARVTSIGWSAFEGCTGLTAITSEASNPPTLGSHVFRNVDKSIPLYVPAESISEYQAADQWSEFTNIQAIPTASVAITANEDPQHAGTYYSTFYYSSGNYELPATGVEAFVATISGSDMNLTRIAGGAGVIPQGTAVILKSTMASYTLTLSDDAPVFDGTNALQGVDEATNTPSNCYVLSAVDGVVGFYQYTGEQVGAHKAYLVYNGAGAPRRMRFVFDEENAVTGVEEAGSETANAMRSEKCIENGQLIIIRDGVRYNAQGQKVK